MILLLFACVLGKNGDSAATCSHTTDAVACTVGSVELPPSSTICMVTVYGVRPTGMDEQYAAVEEVLPTTAYSLDDDTLRVQCPETDGAWAWRSFVATYQ